MGDEITVIPQSAEDKPELCIGVKLLIIIKLGNTKQELVVVTYKVPQLEERSEFCNSKIGIKSLTNEEMADKSELCTGSLGIKLPATIVSGI